jgi:hypothetical protein
MNTTEHRNGCHNRAPLRGHCTYGIDWHEGHPLRAVRIEHPNVMAKDCQYTLSGLGQKDPGCTGCRWRKDLTKGATC